MKADIQKALSALLRWRRSQQVRDEYLTMIDPYASPAAFQKHAHLKAVAWADADYFQAALERVPENGRRSVLQELASSRRKGSPPRYFDLEPLPRDLAQMSEKQHDTVVAWLTALPLHDLQQRRARVLSQLQRAKGARDIANLKIKAAHLVQALGAVEPVS